MNGRQIFTVSFIVLFLAVGFLYALNQRQSREEFILGIQTQAAEKE